MNSSLSSDSISQLGRLARLQLDPEEAARYAEQLTSVVAFIEQLDQVDTTGVVHSMGASGLQTVLAADVLRSATDQLAVSRESLLNGAPASQDGFIAVQAVMAEEGGGA